MVIYCVVDWTTKKTQGPYTSLEDAQGRGMQHVAPGHDYTIWMMPAQAGAATPIEEGRRPSA